MDLDLHIHSKYSPDSLSDPQKIIQTAMKKGLDGIAITDHDSLRGSIEGKKIINANIKLIPGSEITTDKGHILGLFLNTEVRSREFFDVIDEIRDQDAISVLAHPFKKRKVIENEVIKSVDLIEVFNSRANVPENAMNNDKALELANMNGLPMSAGSDAHFCFEIGRGRIRVDIEPSSDLEQIRRALLHKKSIPFGVESSDYVEVSSQLIKYIKFRKIPKLSAIRSYLNK